MRFLSLLNSHSVSRHYFHGTNYNECNKGKSPGERLFIFIFKHFRILFFMRLL